MATLDSDKFKMPTTPPAVVRNVRPRNAPTPMPVLVPPPSQPNEPSDVLFSAPLVPTPMTATGLSHSHSHRKAVPPEVPQDVNPSSGSPMPQVYSSDSDSSSPLEPPAALRPRNGTVSSTPKVHPHQLMLPDSPAQSDIVTYGTTAVTTRVRQGTIRSATPTIVSV